MNAPEQTPPNVLRAARLIGVVLVVGLTALTVWLGPSFPQLATANAAAAWLFGKLFGVPLDAVMQSALRAMQPEKAVALTVSAVQSMPPARAEAVTQSVLQELAAHAVGAMPAEQAQYMTRAILDTIPPEAKARVLEKIVFVQSKSLPPQDADLSTQPAAAKKGD